MTIVLQESLRGLFYAPYYAALTLGAYERERVEVRFVSASSPDAAPNGLFDRTVDVSWGGPMRVNQLYDERSDPGSEESRELWSIVRRVLASTEVASALRETLDEGFRIRSRRSGEAWPVPMHPRPVLYTDLNGYAIKPHPDTRRKVLTMQIYLPSDDSQRELGTTIYKISPMGVFAWKSYGLVKDKTVPFLPNSGYAFVVIHPAFSLLRSSWHGREAISVPVEKPRLSILNTYYRDP